LADTADDASPSDVELLARHVAGDHDAFGELVRRHRDRLWAVALRTMGDPEEAADALQDALVAAFRAAHTFQGRSAVTTWLHRIVVNACLDRLRRSSVRRTKPMEELPTPETALGSAEGADVSVVQGEVRREVAAALAALPDDQRAALVLVDLQGYAVAEAATILGVPSGTIKSRCARGRARLLPALSHLRREGETGAEGSAESQAAARPDESGPRTPGRRTPNPRQASLRTEAVSPAASRGGESPAQPGTSSDAGPGAASPDSREGTSINDAVSRTASPGGDPLQGTTTGEAVSRTASPGGQPLDPRQGTAATDAVSRETHGAGDAGRTESPRGGRNRTGESSVPVVDPTRPEGRR
jgi:RNA polymerase sigma-70 factor (ECF subfamily)